jgi:AcrR family transcriptional regulator
MFVLHEIESPPRERRRAATLERILDAALGQVARDGLDGLQMVRLAAEVDFTPGALYRDVASKDELIARLVERTLVAVRERLAAAVPARATPLGRVMALARAYRTFARREPHRFGLLALALAEPRVLVGDPGHTRSVAVAVVAALTPLADALTAAAEAGALRDGAAVERTLCVFALVHGLAQLPKLGRAAPAPLDADTLVVNGVRTLLIGWGASPRAVDLAIDRTAVEEASS